MDSLQAVFPLIVSSLPFVILYIVGVVVSATKMGLYRKAATLALAGFICLLVGQLIRAAGTIMMLPAYRGDTPMHELTARFAVINLSATALILGGMICVLLAIFAGRKPTH